jgi:hypothetical protein
VRAALRESFGLWGRPGLLRVDNGHPWGSKGDMPTDLALWLIGLDVAVWWNRPAVPQDNGVVERSQGTGKRWGEPHTAVSPEDFQARLDLQDQMQRQFYPYNEKKSRMETYPGLRQSERPYDAAWEEENWQWQRVADHLSGYCLKRCVDRKGQISIYNRNYYVKTPCGPQEVWVTFNSEACHWVVSNEMGVILKEIDAPEVRPERIKALQVTKRRDKHPPG